VTHSKSIVGESTPPTVGLPASRSRARRAPSWAGPLPPSDLDGLRALRHVAEADLPRAAARWARQAVRAGLRPDDTLRGGAKGGYEQYLAYVEVRREVSVEWLVWGPGSATPVHDHRCWCVVTVVEGVEEEVSYRRDATTGGLVASRTARREAGSTQLLLPPDDIHLVSNKGEDVAISLHVYGTDLRRTGTSIEREYDLSSTGRGH
jgi:predicted metal-dependent enzyme (double-stranded beta helix superfamily)